MKLFSWPKSEPLIFYMLMLLLLVPVWSVDFFVTGDGPCHLHNSRLVLDWWQEVNRGFYNPHYHINTSFDPNWLFNLITAPLLAITGAEWTERIFFSLYVLAFGFGFRFLISEINPKAKFISSLGFLFCYHKLLMVGFLNNSLSFAIWFWLGGWWWRNRNNFSPGLMIINAGLILLLFSAHPTGLIFCMLMIGCMMMGLLYYERKTLDAKQSWELFSKRAGGFFMSALPAIVLFAEFINRSDLSSEKIAHPVKNTLQNIANLSALVTMDSKEIILATFTAIICFAVILGALILRLRERKLLPSDGLILFVLFVMLIIFFPPRSISGGLDISLRLAIIPYLAMLCWAATANFPVWSQMAAQLSAIILVIAFLFVRMPIHRHASEYAEEIYMADPFIRDTSTLLVLNYDWTGQTPQGQKIADRIWLFTHVDCYLGLEKSLVISDNYEAHFPYFPMRARWQTHMYGQADKDGINFDHRPPRADILSYKRRTKEDLDYVMMISYRDEFRDHPYTQEIFAQLAEGYDKIFTSKYGRAILYARKGRG